MVVLGGKGGSGKGGEGKRRAGKEGLAPKPMLCPGRAGPENRCLPVVPGTSSALGGKELLERWACHHLWVAGKSQLYVVLWEQNGMLGDGGGLVLMRLNWVFGFGGFRVVLWVMLEGNVSFASMQLHHTTGGHFIITFHDMP